MNVFLGCARLAAVISMNIVSRDFFLIVFYFYLAFLSFISSIYVQRNIFSIFYFDFPRAV